MHDPVAAAPIRGLMPGTLAEVLRARIVDGTYAGGMALRQEALAAEFGVSRMPVREALRQLEAEGLVTVMPHRGVVVRPLTRADAAEIFALRQAIEPMVLAHAVPRLAERHLAEARRHADAFDQGLRAGDRSRVGDLNWRLHATLYGPADQPRAMEILQALHTQAERYLRLQVGGRGAPERAVTDHRRLINLCADRDADGACALLVEHIAAAAVEIDQLLAEG